MGVEGITNTADLYAKLTGTPIELVMYIPSTPIEFVIMSTTLGGGGGGHIHSGYIRKGNKCTIELAMFINDTRWRWRGPSTQRIYTHK